jgi:hypothetical protein
MSALRRAYAGSQVAAGVFVNARAKGVSLSRVETATCGYLALRVTAGVAL